MVSQSLRTVVNHLRQAVRPRESLAPSDRDLLQRFARQHDETAFEELLHRHGPMVLRVSQRLLRGRQDAEDVFQATFLTLARKAGSIRKSTAVGCWLHGVARFLALRLRREAARREAREANAAERITTDPLNEVSVREAQAILDEELARLPERLRAPLVLCYLQGATRDEAARRLGWSLATLKRRLESGRERLRGRLTRRGLTLSAALLTTLLGESAMAALPAGLMAHTVSSAMRFLAGDLDTPGATLAMHALKDVAATKAKLAMGLVLALSLLATGAGLAVGYRMSAIEPQPEDAVQAQERPKAEDQKSNVDSFGDPLPPGALARMGTIRLRQPNPRMVFSADGKTLISAGADNALRTWDLATGKFLRAKVLEGTRDLDSSAISLAPDGKALLVWKYSRKSMAVCDAATGKQLGSLSVGDERPYRAALAPGGKAVAASTSLAKAQAIRLWDVATGTERLLLEHNRHSEHLEFSPNGKFLGVASRDAIRLWEVATGNLMHSLKVEANCLLFSLDSQTMASGNYKGSVKLWDVATGKEQATLQATPAHDIQCLAFSPDGKVLAAGGQRSLRLWDVTARKMIQQFHDWGVYELAFAPDGKVLAGSGGSNIRLWDVATGKRLLFREGHNGEVDSITASPDGKVLATTSYSDGSLCLWDAGTGKLLHQPPGDHVACRSACFSPDGKLLASGGHVGFLPVWETATGKEWRRFPIESLHKEQGYPWIDSLCLSSDGKRLAALARFDRSQINVWDVPTGKLVTSRPFESDAFESFTPDGKGVTVRVPEGMAIQDTITGKHLVTIPGIVDLSPIAFSPDGRLLAVTRRKVVVPEGGKGAGFARADGDRTAVGVAEVATGKEVLYIETGETHRLAFSADGRTLATADENLVRLWEVATGQEIYRRLRHEALPGAPAQATVTSVAILPGGRALATGMMDGTILVWALRLPAATARQLSGEQVMGLWADLASDDARKAYQAVHMLAAAPTQSLPFLKDHLRPASQADSKRVEKLIAGLDNEQFAERDAAAKELTKMGETVAPLLQRALEGQPSAEVHKRIEAILACLQGPPSGESLRALRAIQVLETIGTTEARDLLRKLADGAPTRQTREAKMVLERMKPRP